MNIPVLDNIRGKLAVSSGNNIYAVLPDLRISSASSSSNWTDWMLINTEDSGRFFSDPLIDSHRLEAEGNKLTILYPQKNSKNIYCLDYMLASPAFNASSSENPVTPVGSPVGCAPVHTSGQAQLGNGFAMNTAANIFFIFAPLLYRIVKWSVRRRKKHV